MGHDMPMVAGTPLLEILDLSKQYHGFAALRAVNLSVSDGEFLTLLGPSGSGKSTLLMAIAGFVQPTSGAIRLAGKDIAPLPANKRGLGVVFQNYALFPHMSVLANVMFPMKVRGIARIEAREQAREALARVGLDGFDDRNPATLSGGQRQRVALARAVVSKPRLMLMDEPLSALDKNLRERMQIEIRGLHERLGLTTIYVTHDQREAMAMSDRIAVMDRGQIVQVETPQQLYNAPNSVFTATFIGHANLVTLSALVPLGPNAQAIAAARGGSDELAVLRAEHITLAHSPDTGDGFAFDAEVVRTLFQGEGWLVLLAIGDGSTVEARITVAEERKLCGIAPGSKVRAFVSSDQLTFVPAASR